MLILPQSRTELIFREMLMERGVPLELGVELVDIAPQEDYVQVSISKNGGAAIDERYDYVLAADGARSTIRKKLNIPFDGTTFPGDMYLADYEVINPPTEPILEGHIWDGRTLALITITSNTVRLISNREDYLSLLPKNIQLGKEIWKSKFHVNHRIAREFHQGRVFLAGDAAHIHSPIGARGMNIGIEDVYVLSKLFEAGRTNRYT